jgi:hypothetical protein
MCDYASDLFLSFFSVFRFLFVFGYCIRLIQHNRSRFCFLSHPLSIHIHKAPIFLFFLLN